MDKFKSKDACCDKEGKTKVSLDTSTDVLVLKSSDDSSQGHT